MKGKQTVLNLGHRGAPEAAPENTIPAFLKAMEAGAHGVELDVHLSRDGETIVIHNRTVDKTTDGSGPVSGRTLSELKSLDAGTWFSAEFAGTRLPTLEETVIALPREAFINIETKSGAVAGTALEKKVAEAINRFGLHDRVIVSSFNPLSLARIKKIDRRIETGQLYMPLFPALPPTSPVHLFKPDALHPHYKKVSAAYVAKARARGYRVNVWTVNTRIEMEQMLDLGVDGIITNRPDLLSELLRERGEGTF